MNTRISKHMVLLGLAAAIGFHLLRSGSGSAFADCPSPGGNCPLWEEPMGFEPYEWALGFGKNTKGARTIDEEIDIYLVDDATDPTTPTEGTLRYGIETVAPGNTTGLLIVFDVPGAGQEITLTRPLHLTNSAYVTLDGSSEEGGGDGNGATITGEQFAVIDCHDVMIRYLRFRSGKNATTFHCSRSLHIGGSSDGKEGCWCHDILIDHCSIEDSRDDNLSIYGAVCRITVQNCLIGGSAITSSKGAIIGDNPTAEGYVTLCNNIITDVGGRVPLIGTVGRADFYNNISANYLYSMNVLSDDGTNGPRLNVMNNLFRPHKYYPYFDDSCTGGDYRHWADPITAVIGTTSCNYGGLPSCPQLMNNDENEESVFIDGNYYEYWDGDEWVPQTSQWGLTGALTFCSPTYSYTPNWPTDFQKGSAHSTDAAPVAVEDVWNKLIYEEPVGCYLGAWDTRDWVLIEALLDGEADYITSVSPSEDGFPGTPSSPYPADGATVTTYASHVGANYTKIISWAACEETWKYDLYFAENALPGSATYTNLTTNFKEVNILPNKHYYWKVVAKNACFVTPSPEWDFYTASTLYPEYE